MGNREGTWESFVVREWAPPRAAVGCGGGSGSTEVPAVAKGGTRGTVVVPPRLAARKVGQIRIRYEENQPAYGFWDQRGKTYGKTEGACCFVISVLSTKYKHTKGRGHTMYLREIQGHKGF